jgi:hypothetical protein
MKRVYCPAFVPNVAEKSTKVRNNATSHIQGDFTMTSKHVVYTDAGSQYKKRLETLENRVGGFDMATIEIDTRAMIQFKDLNNEILKLNREIRVMYNYIIITAGLSAMMFMSFLWMMN